MQIVIDIPDKDYNKLMNNKFYGIDGCLDSLVYRLVGNVYEGTPLPKGHGRLIDADELESRMKIGYCIVRDAPTIIEADKAEGGE